MEELIESNWDYPGDLTADREELWATEARALGSLVSAPPAPSHARILQPHVLPGLGFPILCPFLFSKEREEGRGRASAMKRGTVHCRERLGFDRMYFIIWRFINWTLLL